jgi:hypothetical protein
MKTYINLAFPRDFDSINLIVDFYTRPHHFFQAGNKGEDFAPARDRRAVYETQHADRRLRQQILGDGIFSWPSHPS